MIWVGILEISIAVMLVIAFIIAAVRDIRKIRKNRK